MKRWIVVASLGFLVLGVFVLPRLAQTQQQTVLYAAVKKNNGQMRLISNPSECLPSEYVISWNQAGLQGPQGPPGAMQSPLVIGFSDFIASVYPDQGPSRYSWGFVVNGGVVGAVLHLPHHCEITNFEVKYFNSGWTNNMRLKVYDKCSSPLFVNPIMDFAFAYEPYSGDLSPKIQNFPINPPYEYYALVKNEDPLYITSLVMPEKYGIAWVKVHFNVLE